MARTTHHTRWGTSGAASTRHRPYQWKFEADTQPDGDAYADAPPGEADAEYWNVTRTLRRPRRRGGSPGAAAEAIRGKPAPQQVTRSVAWRGYATTHYQARIRRVGASLQRRERARVRDELAAARGTAQSLLADGGVDNLVGLRFAEATVENARWQRDDRATLEVAPTRHRGSARRYAI